MIRNLLGTKIKRKTLFMVAVLIPVCLSAGFMVMEAGDFYASLYQGNTTRGHIAGILTEVFLAFSAAACFKGRKWLNRLIKTVMVLLFIAAVCGSSLKVVAPLLDDIGSAIRQARLERFMLVENKQNQTFLKALEGQKTNTAIAIREAREANRQLKTELSKKPPVAWVGLVLVVASVFLRFCLQLAALVWAHNLGLLWREAFGKKAQVKEPTVKTKRETVRKPRKTVRKTREIESAKQPVEPVTNERPRLVAASGGKK